MQEVDVAAKEVMKTATKRAMALAARAIATATERAKATDGEGNGDGGKSGNSKGAKSDGYGNKEGNGNCGKIDGNNNKEGDGKGGQWQGWEEFWQRQLWWQAMKREMMRAATGNGYGKEGGGRSTVAMMGTVQRTRPLALRLERGG